MTAITLEHAVLGGGCFWCLDSVFSSLKGVQAVVCGYTGGHTTHPTYDDICTGTTGHAEVVAIDFNPQIIDFSTLLDIFFTTHDPTTLNRQGNDVGTQYRSVIYYQTEEQQQIALHKIQQQGLTVVTEVSATAVFYPAEDYHQQFFTKNPFQGYCMATIPKKINKLHQLFNDKLK